MDRAMLYGANVIQFLQVRRNIARGAEVNALDDNGRTPFIMACKWVSKPI
jgi:ankyrin repeat protein